MSIEGEVLEAASGGISLQAKLIAALALLIALIGENWYVLNMGKRIERADWQKQEITRKSTETAALFKASENAFREKQNDEAKARKVSDDHQKELAAIRSFQPGAGSLRLPRAICDSASPTAKAASAGGFDGATSSSLVLPDEIGRAFDRFTAGAGQLAKEADTSNAVARGLQSFARESGLYGAGEQGEIPLSTVPVTILP